MADESGEEVLDPRVQIQLEKLNTCTDEINRLEVELDDANSLFRATLTDSSHKLRLLSKRLGKAIEAARPYYEAKDHAHKAQLECQRAAVQYQRASEIHQAAKETISLAEQRFLSNQGEWEFDNAWQEMLNHATMKVMEAEAMRLESEREHRKRAASFTEAEHRVHSLERRLKKDIAKSRLYFEMKSNFQKKLQEIKGQVETLRKAVSQSKQSYTDALRSLELISSEIHEKRKLRIQRDPRGRAELHPSVPSSHSPTLTLLTELGTKVFDASSTGYFHGNSQHLEVPCDRLSRAESESYGSLGSSHDSPSNGSTLSLPADLSRTALADMLMGLSLDNATRSEQCSGYQGDSRKEGSLQIGGPDEFEDIDLNAD
ncbi:SH3 domain-binding protein 5 homolog [Ornithodoros turicata]|uniref:SH3 domain-binding protein 5 homolog n=1 Tax=Ornithodoros turicata TaxID=34597 RepID=UPI003138A71A